jgi:hypothetical protein
MTPNQVTGSSPSAIPIVSQSEAEVLKLRLAKRSAGGQTPADEGS